MFPLLVGLRREEFGWFGYQNRRTQTLMPGLGLQGLYAAFGMETSGAAWRRAWIFKFARLEPHEKRGQFLEFESGEQSAH